MLTVDVCFVCHCKLYMYDSYGDGWNGVYLEVTMNGSFVGIMSVKEVLHLILYITTGYEWTLFFILVLGIVK